MEFAATVMLAAIVLYLLTQVGRPGRLEHVPRIAALFQDRTRQRLDRRVFVVAQRHARCGPCGDAPGG